MSDKKFRLDMTVAQAMDANGKVPQVLATHGVGGCAHCGMSQVETLEQLCASYGIDPTQLLDELEMTAADAGATS